MSTVKYLYRARKMNGQAVSGEVVARSLDDANEQLSQQGLIPVAVTAWNTTSFQNLALPKNISAESIKEFFGSVPPKELMMFTQQLQTVIAVGVPITQGLTLIANQTEHLQFKKVISDLVAAVSEGSSLARAMAKHPKVFTDVYVNMITVGETSGSLEAVLARMYEVLEAESITRQKVKSALFYPKMVMGMIVLVFIVVVSFVIPKMRDFYTMLGAGALPLPTRIVLGISDFVIGYWWLASLLVIGIWYTFKKWVESESGSRTWDQIKLKTPVVGALIIDTEMNSFCVILEMLIHSGVGIVQSLDILKGTLRSKMVQDSIDTCRKNVIAGGKIAETLNKDKYFPKMLSGLISVAEESGALEKVLNRTGRYYKAQVEYKVNNLSKAIEPFLLAVTFGMVLLLALAILLPIWNAPAAMRGR
jgi:MSHA biogenesis protein MshG